MARTIFQKITEEAELLAILYNKTKDRRYKLLWYKKLKLLPKL
jgi:hypothetical protein